MSEDPVGDFLTSTLRILLFFAGLLLVVIGAFALFDHSDPGPGISSPSQPAILPPSQGATTPVQCPVVVPGTPGTPRASEIEDR